MNGYRKCFYLQQTCPDEKGLVKPFGLFVSCVALSKVQCTLKVTTPDFYLTTSGRLMRYSYIVKMPSTQKPPLRE
jgi:hypothetical protein